MQRIPRLDLIAESAISEVSRLAEACGAVNLASGAPDWDAPPELVEVAVEALRGGHNQYAPAWGGAALRQAIAGGYGRWYGMNVDADRNVTVTVGVTEGIVAAVLGLISPGERVIIVEPAYETYWPAVLFAGGQAVYVPLDAPGFRLDADRLEAAFGDGARAVVPNTPHNPTGRVFSRAELQMVADLCQQYDAICLTDEIYEHIVYDGRQHVAMATLPGMAERTLTFSGLSKTYSATGWRIGWAVGAEPLTNALRKVHGYLVICPPAPLQQAAVTAFDLPDRYYADLKELYTHKRALLTEILAECGFRVSKPEGAYFVMADFSPLGFAGNDASFARFLTETVGVAAVPGGSFYHDPTLGRTLLRFAFPKREETLEEAGRRLRRLGDLLG